MSGTFIDMKHLQSKVNLSHTQIYNRIREGKFPAGQKIGTTRIWEESEINNWIEKKQSKKISSEENL